MKPSPLTLHSIQFLRVHVEPLETDEKPLLTAAEFDFAGTELHWVIQCGALPETNHWWVALGFATNVAASESPCPYTIDMQAMGVVSVADSVADKQHESLAAEYGATLVFGAIREMVSTITARSVLGTLMLPTPSFKGIHDELTKQGSGNSTETNQ